MVGPLAQGSGRCPGRRNAGRPTGRAVLHPGLGAARADAHTPSGPLGPHRRMAGRRSALAAVRAGRRCPTGPWCGHAGREGGGAHAADRRHRAGRVLRHLDGTRPADRPAGRRCVCRDLGQRPARRAGRHPGSAAGRAAGGEPNRRGPGHRAAQRRATRRPGRDDLVWRAQPAAARGTGAGQPGASGRGHGRHRGPGHGGLPAARGAPAARSPRPTSRCWCRRRSARTSWCCRVAAGWTCRS